VITTALITLYKSGYNTLYSKTAPTEGTATDQAETLSTYLQGTLGCISPIY